MDDMSPTPPTEQNWNQNGCGWRHLKFMASQNQVPVYISAQSQAGISVIRTNYKDRRHLCVWSVSNQVTGRGGQDWRPVPQRTSRGQSRCFSFTFKAVMSSISTLVSKIEFWKHTHLQNLIKARLKIMAISVLWIKVILPEENLLLYMFLCGQWFPKLLQQMCLFPCSWYLSVDGRKTTLLACVSFPCITSDQPRSFCRPGCDQILKVTYDNRRGRDHIYSSNSM